MGRALGRAFFEREDARFVARGLVGKHLFTRFEGHLVGGRIVETEAYCAKGDAALALHLARRPRASAALRGVAGRAYLYVVQGGNVLFNVVCGPEGVASAVLIRAAEPLDGETAMASPGVLSRTFGLRVSMSGVALGKRAGVWIEDAGESPAIDARARIGLAYAGVRASTSRWRYVMRT